MKRILKISNILIILFILFTTISFANTTNTLVNENLNEDIMLISEDEVIENNEINRDLFITQDNIAVEENVNGSLYLIGNNINVSSPEINGNIFAIGDKITIGGKINGSVYAIGTDVEVCGDIEDLYLITDDLEIMEQGICRDVKVIANQIEVSGLVNRDLYAFSNGVNIENTDTSKVGGVLHITGNVTGQTDRVNEISKIDVQVEKNDEIIEAISNVFKTVYFISTAITAFAIIGVVVLCTKKRDVYKSEVKEMFLKDFLQGAVNWVICAIIILILILTIVGIPLAILLTGIIWLLFWKFNLPIASIELSKFVLKDNSNSKWLIFLVAFIIFLVIHYISLVPIIGELIKYIISLYGFGFMYRKIFKRNTEPKIEAEIVKE